MTSLWFRFFPLVLVLVLLLARETSSRMGSSSSVNYPSSMVMWQNFPVEIVVASHLQIAVTKNSTEGSQKFHTTLHKNTDFPRETLITTKRYNYPLKFSDDGIKYNRENNPVALENGNKATFDCQVELPFIGYTKPWIELDTGNIYCIFFPYSKNIRPPHHASVKEASHVSAPSFAALLLGRLSVSETGKMMNITTEVNNVIISILENSDVQIHWRKKDFVITQSKVKKQSVKDQVIVTLSAGHQLVRMIIRYTMDESQIPMPEKLVNFMLRAFVFGIPAIINCLILFIKISKIAADAKIEEKDHTTNADEYSLVKRMIYNLNKKSRDIREFAITKV